MINMLFKIKEIFHIFKLSFNPLTTHGVHMVVQALNKKNNAVSMLDLSVGLVDSFLFDFIYLCVSMVLPCFLQQFNLLKNLLSEDILL